MEFLRDRDFLPGFLTGVILHVIMLWTRISIFPLPMKCIGGCLNLVKYDIPASILYFAFDDGTVIFTSLLVGSVLWGFYFYGLLKLFKRFLDR